MNLLKMAYRNVSRQKRRSNLLGLAIAFGVMIIILVNSLTQGLIQNTERNFESALGGHIYLSGEVLLDSGRTANRIDDTQTLDAVIPQFDDYIAGYQKRSTISGTFVFRSKTTRGMLYGVHWDQELSLEDTLSVSEGSLDRIGEPGTIVLPQEVVDDLGVVLGERILLSFDTVTGQANVGEFTVVAITQDSLGLGFSAAYADIGYVNQLLGLDADEYQSLNLVLTDLRLVDSVSAQMRTALEAYGAPVKPEPPEADSPEAMMGMSMDAMFGSAIKDEPWEGTRFNIGNLNDFMDMVTQIVAILNGIALGMFLVMLLITRVGLVNTFRMIMIERTKEIGTMRSVGMLRKDVAALFLLEGLILALRGAFFGILAAMVLGLVGGAIPFPAGSHFAILLHNGRISVPVVPSNILLVTFLIAGITLLAVWSPARKAARLLPADALRS